MLRFDAVRRMIVVGRIVSRIEPRVIRRAERFLCYSGRALLARGRARKYFHVAWLLVGGLAFAAMSDGSPAPSTVFLFFALATITMFDALASIIPDALVAALACAGLILGLKGWGPALTDQAAACALGYLGFRGLSAAYAWLRGAPGMGLGDAKLLGAGGAWIGVAGLPTCVLLASLSACVTLLVVAHDGRSLRARSAMPFGPHLALGVWLVWLVGPLSYS